MTAANATEAAPVELAPVDWAPVALARVDIVRACFVCLVIAVTLGDDRFGMTSEVSVIAALT
jgi:hypothetical protein